MRLSKRGWNNVLILGILFFMLVLNAPTWIKNNLLDHTDTQDRLFPQNVVIDSLRFPSFTLIKTGDQWSASVPLEIPVTELIERWSSLKGTVISEQQFNSLRKSLPKPQQYKAVVFNQEHEFIFYPTKHFWLFQNWQQKWIAITVDKAYLFPIKSETKKI